MISTNATDLDASAIDYALHMRRALSLAQNVITTTPNPRVGCVIVSSAGEVVGEGWHQAPGEAHAEVNAIEKAGERSRGAIAFVSLEPCAHFGKTPPCTNALISAGISRVVIASLDPDPRVAGQGVALLEQAGIEVFHLEEFSARAKAINPGYMKRMTTGLPYVRCKLAMSLDGRTAAANRQSKWITGPAARADVQRLRAGSCAIVTGINTVVADDPAMTVRAEELGLSETSAIHNRFALSRQPLRVILDTTLRIPRRAKIVQTAGPIAIICANGASIGAGEFPPNVEIISPLSDNIPGPVSSRVDPLTVLELLAPRHTINEVLLESGPQLSGAFVQAGLVDELIIYIGGTLLGSKGLPLLELPALESMSDQIKLVIKDIKQIGTDCRIVAVFE